MFNLLVVVKEIEDSVNHYYFLWALTIQDGGRRKEVMVLPSRCDVYSTTLVELICIRISLMTVITVTYYIYYVKL